MSEFSQRLQWARVEYQPGAAPVVFARLSLLGTASDAMGLSGMTGNESVQVATYLAGLRDTCASWNPLAGGPYATMAAFSKTGAPERMLEGNSVYLEKKFKELASRDYRFTPVVGDAPFLKTATRAQDFNPTNGWGRKLALAIDEVLQRMGRSEQGGETPPTVEPAQFARVIPLIVIVTGAAIAVIGSVAVWRYLDPDLRRDIVMVEDAARNYATRLGLWKETGTMPPPSVSETEALSTVESLAKSRSGSDWLWGAGIAGGITLAAVVSVAISKAASGGRAA
jgi:hypothetical protein